MSEKLTPVKATLEILHKAKRLQAESFRLQVESNRLWDEANLLLDEYDVAIAAAKEGVR